MIFIDGPSLFADVSKWQEYLVALEKMPPDDETVVSEKERTRCIIERLQNSCPTDHKPIPD